MKGCGPEDLNMVACQNALLHLTWHAEKLEGAFRPEEVRDHIMETMTKGYIHPDTSTRELKVFSVGEYANAVDVAHWVRKTALGVFPVKGDGEGATTVMRQNAWAGKSS